MEYIKQVLASNKNFKITHHINTSSNSNKCVITFGEIDSNMEEIGFGSKLIMSAGLDHIYVAQKRHTQYQFLSVEKFKEIVSEAIIDKEVYTYGSSLGGYCAIFYGGIINANILAMSPRIPAHPVINKLMGERYKNRGFYHNELNDENLSDNNVCIFYDNKNYIDAYYTNVFLKLAYPNASYYHIENAGHYTARALLLSDELKNVALDFFNNKELTFTLKNENILNWHIEMVNKRLEQGKLSHAQENIEVLLSSEKANVESVRKLVVLYKEDMIERNQVKSNKKSNVSSEIYPIISQQETSRLKEAVSLSFVGDLILLRDQVLNSYNPKTNSYEFDNMFTYIKKYLENIDFNMGVFEGPTAGEKYEYSTSVYSDNIPLYLNFPDSFAHAVKRAGFDFVTTAQNHLLDCGVDGAMRTLDVLDQAGLSHLGCYRNAEEKEKLPIFNIKGLKVAILTYTKRSNRYKNSFFLEEKNKHLTSILVAPSDEHFDQVKNDILNDFEKVKKENPDCIIVLPHMGQQFRHSPDIYQKTWCDIFVDAGADIILSDHPHAVQPYEWRKKPGQDTNVLILHCPGNFVNSYTPKDGDASALTQIFLDPKSGEPFALACVPLWAHSFLDGNYRALPIYDVIVDNDIRKYISTHEFSRVKEIHELVTKTMLGEKLPIDHVQEKYYLFADRANTKSKGYVRNRVAPLTITEDMRKKKLYDLLTKAKSVCFVGDSVTEGTRNGGYGWFEPLVESFKHLKVERFAKGGEASPYFLEHAKTIAEFNCELYILAIGTNDVRYRDRKRCAMTSKVYIKNIMKIVKEIKSKNSKAQIIFIAPWTTDEYDPISKLAKEERFKMLRVYSAELKKYALSIGALYINPNTLIKAKFKTRNPSTWLNDHIHPNAHEGIRMYSWAVIEASPKKGLGIRTAVKRLVKKLKVNKS